MYERVLVVLRALFVQSQIEQVSLRRSIGCGDSFLGDSFFFFSPILKIRLVLSVIFHKILSIVS